MNEVAFYCVADRRFFLGAVGLVNSLRVQGHAEPIYLLDCGLSATQRELLAAEVTLVESPTDASPHVLKAVAPLAHPAEVAVLIDTDMIATRPLGPIVERAAAGEVVAVRNDVERWFPEWGELLDLGEATPRPYVSSGLVGLGGELGREVVELLSSRADRVDFERTFWRRNEPDYPFLYADQCVLNGILSTRVPAERLVALPRSAAPTPPFDGLRIADPERLRVRARDGSEPYVLHHFHRKPWLVRMRSNVYSRLLARLLLGDDVPIRVPAEDVPLRMRPGAAARADRLATDLVMAFPGAARRVRERVGR